MWPAPRRRRADCAPSRPPLPASLSDFADPAAAAIYRDGTYLISSWGEARTWAVFQRGRWGVVYEWGGEQPLAGWVAPDQIPLEVRARALRPVDGAVS